MPKSMLSDDIIKASLQSMTEEIIIPNGMFSAIEHTLTISDKKATGKSKNGIFSLLFPLGLSFMKTAATVLGVLVLACILTLVYSPQTRAWAAEKLDGVNNVAINIVADGYDYVVTGIVSITTGNGTSNYEVYSNSLPSDSEIERRVGYHVKFPNCLPNDSKGDLYIIAKKGLAQMGYNGKETYYAMYNDNLRLDISDEAWPSFAYKVKIGETTFYYSKSPYAEYPVVLDKNGLATYDITQKPNGSTIIYSLSWEDNGVYYQLTDFNDSLALEDAIKMAETIINME